MKARMVPTISATIAERLATFLLKITDSANLNSLCVNIFGLLTGVEMITKIFIRTFPSAEECELFESILQTKWPELLKDTSGVKFQAIRNAQAPHISTVVWEFPDEATQATIEQLIVDNISRFTKTLSPKTLTFSGARIMYLES